MTVDLWMLLAATVLQWALIMGAATPGIVYNGMPWAAGNREAESAPLPGWAVRLKKASDNLQENLVLFAIVVLLVHVTGKGSATSALGAEIFVGARLLHAPIYMAGLPWVRTGVWAVSIAGLAVVGSALF